MRARKVRVLMDTEGRLREGNSRNFFAFGDRSKWLKKLPRTFPRRRHNLHPCGGGLSVTHDAAVRDNGKAKTADTQSGCRPLRIRRILVTA